MSFKHEFLFRQILFLMIWKNVHDVIFKCSQFLLLAVVVFYKVLMNAELVNTEQLLLDKIQN